MNPLGFQRDMDYAHARALPGILQYAEVTAAPASEPLALAEMKQHLVIEHTDDDALIQGYMRAARQRIERAYGWAIGGQTVQAVYLGPASYVKLPRLPVRSVTTITLERTGGQTETVASSALSSAALLRGELRRADGAALFSEGGQITVVYVAGYKLSTESGVTTPPLDENIIQAIQLLVADYYEHRGTFAVGTVAARLPQSVTNLLGLPPAMVGG